MEVFNEQLVKRAKKPKQLIIKILSVVLLITVPLVCFILAFPLKIAYLIYIAFFIFLIGIYIVWYVFSIQKIEYEYAVSGGMIEIAKIIALRKRKTMCKLQISDIEILDKDEKVIDTMRFAKRIEACADINDENNYYAVFNSVAYGRTLLIFAPNEKILNAMKGHLKKDIVLKIFYKRG